MAIGASRIFHVNSNCTDIARSLAFYRDLLGFTATTHPMPDRPQPGGAFGLDEVLWDGWILQGDLGYAGASLDLLEWKVPAPGGQPPQTVHEPGFHRLCFVVPDFDETLAAMRTAGVPLVGSPYDIDSGDGTMVPTALVQDPDGVPVQLLQGDNRRLSHVVVNCRDLDRSVAYYRDVMGLTVVDGQDQPAQPPMVTRSARLVDPGSGFGVQLVQFVRPAMPAVRERRANDIGLFRMAWSTNDCAADERVVRAAGSVPFAPTGALSVGDHLPLLMVLFWPGPDGECLELIEVTGTQTAQENS